MKRLTVLAFFLAILAVPASVLGTPGKSPRERGPRPNEKSVPEPATMLLVGAGAAAYVGLRKLLRRNDG